MAIYKNLLGHNLEKFGAVTVFDATLYDGDIPLITFDTLTVSNISVEGEQKEIRGGQGADLLISYDYGKSASIEITDALASIYSLKYLWGAQIKHQNIEALVRREFNPTDIFKKKSEEDYIDEEINKIEDRKEGTPVTLLVTMGETQYFIDTEDKDEDGKITLIHKDKDNKPLFNIEELKLDNITKVIVYYTQELTNTDNNNHIYELVLTTTDFPKVMRLVGETFFVDVNTGKKIFAQIEIPRFKLNTDFELTFEAEGDASVFDFSGVALSDGGELIRLKTLGYVDNENEEGEKTLEKGKNPEDIVVTFNYKENEQDEEKKVVVPYGSIIPKDEYPNKDNTGWYYDEDHTKLYDPNHLVTHNFSLYK